LRACARTALVGVSQAVNAAGYFWERFT
jgi:hypothetical protein